MAEKIHSILLVEVVPLQIVILHSPLLKEPNPTVSSPLFLTILSLPLSICTPRSPRAQCSCAYRMPSMFPPSFCCLEWSLASSSSHIAVIYCDPPTRSKQSHIAFFFFFLNFIYISLHLKIKNKNLQ